MLISCVIPAKSTDDQNLKDLLRSIFKQNFPQDQIETIVVTKGDSEQAKAIGIRQAKGEIIAMFCADNLVTEPNLFSMVYSAFSLDDTLTGVYSKFYQTIPSSNSLDRYFALIGGNDLIPIYLGKADRKPWYDYDPDEISSYVKFPKKVPSLGCNGFFYRANRIKKANLDHYYPMDCAEDLRKMGYWVYERLNLGGIWHRTTDGKFFEFFKRRYRYAKDLYSDRQDRRWKMLADRKDYFRLFMFCLYTITGIQPLFVTFRGLSKVRDWAWLWHWPMCIGFLITYFILAVRNLFRYGRLFQCKQVLSSPVMAVQTH